MKESGCMAAGAFSRLSNVLMLPLRVRMTMNPPPPTPQENGSTTPSTPAAATAASTALPPRRRVWIAARVARASTVAAAPPVPRSVGVLAGGSCAVAAGAEHSASVTPVVATSARLIGPPPKVGRGLPADLPRHAQERRGHRLPAELPQA